MNKNFEPTPPIRPALSELFQRLSIGKDDCRPDAVARRRGKSQRTARKNMEDLLDKDSFVEYGELAITAQRGRRPVDDLIAKTPADGLLITGIGTVNAHRFVSQEARCIVVSYDYTVLNGKTFVPFIDSW